MESAKGSKEMIYDTLTVRPTAMHVYRDYLKPTVDNTLFGSTQKWRHWKVDAMKRKFSSFNRYYPHISKESYLLLKKNNFKVPCLPKEEVQRWIKRGREYYSRDKGKRCDVKYFIVEEYGPSTSRPHFHVLFFGVNYSDYMHYWGNPWREEFGWTKPSYHRYSADKLKDFSCISKYVSKYVTKGSFDSPWIVDGVAPKPYRLISKGIGSEYLDRSFFDVFKSSEFIRWMEVNKISDKVFETKCKALKEENKYKELMDLTLEFEAQKKNVEVALMKKLRAENLGEKNDYIDLSSISEEQFDKVCVYFDNQGYMHKLPIYYRTKLFHRGNGKNIYEFEVQNVIQSRARLYDNQIIQGEAAQLGIIIPDNWLTKDRSTWKLSASDAFMVDNQHLLQQRIQAKTLAERRKARLTNFYNRSAVNTSAPALL